MKGLYLDAGPEAIPVSHRDGRLLVVVENRKPHFRFKGSDLEFVDGPIYTRLLAGGLDPVQNPLRMVWRFCFPTLSEFAAIVISTVISRTKYSIHFIV